ncbi:GntR family transcriptional regulator, partial [Gemmiger sp.]
MPKAKYEGIYHSIQKRIEAQDYPYQSLLPSENTLIEEYACSRNTVRRALAELVADG